MKLTLIPSGEFQMSSGKSAEHCESDSTVSLWGSGDGLTFLMAMCSQR
jgi:hypothetical protein